MADRPLLGLDGPAFVLPFVDDDYVGESDAGAHELFLVPDEANLAVQPEGADLGWVDEFLSDEPTDGCWTLPFDWPDAAGVSTAILNAVRLAPGETVRHG